MTIAVSSRSTSAALGWLLTVGLFLPPGLSPPSLDAWSCARLARLLWTSGVTREAGEGSQLTAEGPRDGAPVGLGLPSWAPGVVLVTVPEGTGF